LLVRTVSETAGTENVAGCGSVGVIANGREIETEHGVAVLVVGGGSISAARFFVPQLRRRAREAALELAEAVRPRLGHNNLLCLFADSYNLDPGPFVDTLNREFPDLAIVGGGATEDGATGETFVFCGDVVSSNSVSGILFSGDFDIKVRAAQACAPLGRLHEVTAVRDNVILELDHRRAYDIFAEAAGPLAGDFARAATFVFLGVPIRADATRLERGQFLVRNLLGVSEEHGALAVAHRPQLGDHVGFVLRDPERSRGELKAMLEDISADLPNPAFGLYFDCVSRGINLYKVPDHDAAYIGRHTGNAPVAGFFTGFEIGPLGESQSTLQYTGVLALVGETKA
jgi:small ligand-binding sensory domain FIST